MAGDFPYDVFLSHSEKDRAVVRPLAERLRKDGLKVWFDEWVLRAGDSIPAKIEEGLEVSRVLVLCMSANAFGSDLAQLEAGAFRFRDPLNKERRLVPLRLDNAPIKGSLGQFLYIDWLSIDREQAYAKLLSACRQPETWPESPRIIESTSPTSVVLQALATRRAEGELLLTKQVVTASEHRIWEESALETVKSAFPNDSNKQTFFVSPSKQLRTSVYREAIKTDQVRNEERAGALKEQLDILASFIRQLQELSLLVERVRDEKASHAPLGDPVSPSRSDFRPLVVLVHGIRTGGRWMKRIKPLLEEEGRCVVEPAGFGFFDLFRFLLPGAARRYATETVRWKLQHAISMHPDRPLIIIAHSFGTYCVTQILKENPQIRPVRMLFCGSIVAQDFRWDSLKQMDPSVGVFVINECGARDIWPPLAHSMTFGYGASGTGGFQVAGVADRCHDLPHSGYFTTEFVRRFWVPFITGGIVAHSDFENEMREAPWWISVIGLRPLLPWLAWIFLATVIWLFVLAGKATYQRQLGSVKRSTIQILYNGLPSSDAIVIDVPKAPFDLLQGFVLTNDGGIRSGSLTIRVGFNGTNFAYEAGWDNRGNFQGYLLNFVRIEPTLAPGEAWPIPALQVNVLPDYFKSNVDCKITISHDGGKVESRFQIRPAKSFRSALSAVSSPDENATKASPKWQPPDLPPDCTNVVLFFGNQYLTMPVVLARISPEGTKFNLNELPPDFTNGYERLPTFKAGMTNIWVRRAAVKGNVGNLTIDYPIAPYVKNNRLFVYVQMPFQAESRIISMSDDLDSPLPATWDRNYNSNAFEVVREDGKPVLQVFYTRPNQVRVNGIFIVNTNCVYETFGGTPCLIYPQYRFVDLATTQEVTITNINVVLEIETNSIYTLQFTDQKPIFKYPAWKYLGQYAD